jgi:hypothetical protein
VNEPDLAKALIEQPMMAAAVVAVGAMAILKIVNEVIRLREHLLPKPATQEVRDEAAVATAHVTERVVKIEASTKDLDRRVAGHDADILSLRNAEHECAARVHERIDDIATVVNHTNGKVEAGMSHITASLKEIRLIVLAKKEPS